MEYKKEFENTNVYVDKTKCFFVANNENREILFKLVPIIFENDVNTKDAEPKSNSVDAKRETKRRKSNNLAV
jgi:hypothetical protein